MFGLFFSRKKTIFSVILILIIGGYYLAWKKSTKMIVDHINNSIFAQSMKINNLTVSGFPLHSNFKFTIGDGALDNITETVAMRSDPVDISAECDALMRACTLYSPAITNQYISLKNSTEFTITSKVDNPVSHFKFGRGLLLSTLLSKPIDELDYSYEGGNGTMLLNGKLLMNTASGKSFIKVLNNDKEWLFATKFPLTFSLLNSTPTNIMLDFEASGTKDSGLISLNINDIGINALSSEIDLKGKVDLSSKTGFTAINLTYKANSLQDFAGVIENWIAKFAPVDKKMQDSIASSLNKFYLAQKPYSQTTDPRNILINIIFDQTKNYDLQIGNITLPGTMMIVNGTIVDALKNYTEIVTKVQQELKAK